MVGVPREAFRPSPVFLGLVAVTVTGGVLAWSGVGNPRFDAFLLVIGGWLVSLSLHEYAHAIVAYRAGDVGVASRGYLTLNPLRYTHAVLSIILPLVFVLLGGIGLPGGAVWVDRSAIRSRVADSLISLCGPAVNLLLAVGLAIPYAFGAGLGPHGVFFAALAFLGFLQLTAGLLNLLPVPGLDGYGALRPWLRYDTRKALDHVAPYGMLLVFALLWQPRANAWFFTAVYRLADLIGLPPFLIEAGNQLIRFWTG